MQAGIISYFSSGAQYNESWVEVYPYVASVNLPLCQLAVGDTVNVHVESNLNNDGYDYFFMENLTANNCMSSCTVHTDNNAIPDTCGFSGGPSFNSDSATGECIVERPAYDMNGDLYPLAQFNPSDGDTVQMQGCLVNGIGIGSQSHNYLIIVNGNSQLLAGCGPIDTNNTLPVTWYGSS